MIKFRQKNDKK